MATEPQVLRLRKVTELCHERMKMTVCFLAFWGIILGVIAPTFTLVLLFIACASYFFYQWHLLVSQTFHYTLCNFNVPLEDEWVCSNCRHHHQTLKFTINP